MSPLESTANGLLIRIRITPNVARDKIDRLDVDAAGTCRLRVTVTVVPEKGKANKALIKYLSKAWHLPKSSFTIIAGELTRNKMIEITGNTHSLRLKIEKQLTDVGVLRS